MSRLFIHVALVFAACAPLLLLVVDLAQKYPPDTALLEIGLFDAILLLVSLGLPLLVLSRLGVIWRAGPDEF